jgi:hypothetical protein
MEANAGADSATDTQMLARCLGYLLRELPHEAGGGVAQEIMDCGARRGRWKRVQCCWLQCATAGGEVALLPEQPAHFRRDGVVVVDFFAHLADADVWNADAVDAKPCDAVLWLVQ